MQQLLFGAPPANSPETITTDLMNESIPFHAAEALIEEYLLNELSDFEPLDVKTDASSDINCKWKFSSACQKSIRRGHVEDSVRYALAYHSVDPVGFWNRLVLVAFEDIGVGDVWAVAMTLAAARSTVWRKKAGGDKRIIKYLVKRMAESVKDRTVADMFQVLENRSLPPESLILLKSSSPQELSGIALSGQHPYELRIAATWMLWGDRMKNPRLPLEKGSPDLFDATIERLKVPGLVKYITLRGMVACRGCGMNLTYPLVWLMMNQSSSVKLIATELPERFYIGGVPEEAWDKHTRQGKTAYQHFYRTCEPVQSFLTGLGVVGSDSVVAAIGIAIFISESALLDTRADFENAEQVYMMTVEDDYRKNGLTLADGRELSRLIQENHAVLRQARQSVVEGKRGAKP